MRQIVTSDVGGTHARFAVATIAGGKVRQIGHPVIFETAGHASFQIAWEEFARRSGRDLPQDLAICFAGPVSGDVLKLTNNSWVIRPSLMFPKMNVRRYTIVNDFGAVAHAVAALGATSFKHLSGPDIPLPTDGVVTIIGPGTGLGVAALLCRRDMPAHVIETEGGHVDFAPLNSIEDRILTELRRSFRRVSVERLVSGRGLLNIYNALGVIEGKPAQLPDERQLWAAALDGSDSLATAALERFCQVLGAVAGDLALAQGAQAIVIGGGLGLRLAEHLPRSGFRDRLIAKGRFERTMSELPVKLITDPQPGLFGAAAAFAS